MDARYDTIHYRRLTIDGVPRARSGGRQCTAIDARALARLQRNADGSVPVVVPVERRN